MWLDSRVLQEEKRVFLVHEQKSGIKYEYRNMEFWGGLSGYGRKKDNLIYPSLIGKGGNVGSKDVGYLPRLRGVKNKLLAFKRTKLR